MADRFRAPDITSAAAVYRFPTAEQVAALVESHGWEAAFERWSFIGRRTLCTLAAEGRRAPVAA